MQNIKGYAAPGYGAGGYGQAPPAQGYGYNAPQQPQYNPPYGGQPMGYQQQGYGAPSQGYGAQPGGYMGAPPQSGYAYAAPSQQPAYAPPLQNGYGAPPQNGYIQTAGYGAPQQSHNPVPSQYGYPNNAGGPGAPPPATYNKRESLATAAPPVKKYTPADQVEGNPSIKPCAGFNAESDASALAAAIKGGSGRSVINIITDRSTDQRQEIRLMYKTMLGRDIFIDLSNAFNMNLHRVIASLMRSEAERDAHLLYKAMKGRGYDEDTLLEILVSRDNDKLKDVRVEFKKMYNKDLEAAFIEECSGAFKKLVIGLLQANRTPWKTPVNIEKCKKDAKALYDAGEGTWGTETSEFRRLVCLRSIPQLQCIFREYHKICKYTLEQSCKREMSGDLLKGMKTIIRFAMDSNLFFAKVLYKSMKGFGTDDRKLIRTIVTRCEYDLLDIKVAFEREYNAPLSKWIKSETSGEYKNCLLLLIGEDI